jgi:2',3'-cyclic-nucleotide 2'-phosphodiesterase (5'-nucleotidase family)
MQKLRKTLSLLLAMTMLLTLPGISAGAADTDALPAGEETVVSDDISADSSVPAGDDAVSGAAGETVSQKTPESVDTTGKTPEDTAAAAEDGTAKQTAATEGTAEATEADQAAIPAAQSEEEKTEDGEDTEIPGNAVEKLLAEAEAGDTVILHSNDVHGAIDGYAYIAGVRDLLEKNGVNVILADAGDYSQGTTYVSTTKGADAVTMMNAAGYDVATLGNHEFDYGYAQLKANLGKAAFKVVCADVLENGSTIYDGCTIIEKGGVKIGFFGLETPEAQTKANPSLIQGLTFLAGQEMYTCAQQQADALKAAGADVVVGLVHLGVDAESAPNRSYDLWNNMKGVDFLIDGHSHTVMTKGDNGESIQSTGTAFANIGYVLIDKDTKKIESNGLIPVDESVPTNADVVAAAQTIIKRVDAEYDVTFAKSEVDLNGDREPGNRTEETNLGDLITDAMMWAIQKDEGSITVPEENVVAITNGGGIRAWIHAGDITKNDINTVLPFGNTLAVVYVTGAELLEALEASTYCTPVSIGGFPQAAGIEFTIDTTKAYDANEETYPGSTYYGPKSINRVTIDSVNGQPFDEDATYAVITNDFCAAGGDTYYAFASASSQFDTGMALDEILMNYITEELNGVVGQEYAEPRGSINVIVEEDEDDGKIVIGGLDLNVWMTKYGNVYTDCQATDFFDKMGYTWGDLVTVRFLDQELVLPVVPTYSYVDSGEPAIIIEKRDDGTPTGYLSMAINMGNFASTYGIAEKHTNDDGTVYWTACDGVEFPVEVSFEMAEQGGYMAEYLLHDLTRTNNREDYADLSDEEFANFRVISTTGMGENVLYRTSSPINPELGRNEYADAAIKKAGVTVIMNLADDEETAQTYEGFDDSYYSGQKVIYLNLGVDFSEQSFRDGLAKGLRFFAENPGTYAVHCTEGKDRAGFVSALLECLMGATYDEVVEDYMVSYINYYGVEKGSEKYQAIADSNIVKTLKNAFGVDDLTKADLSAEAKGYLKEIGMTDSEINALMVNLGYDVCAANGHSYKDGVCTVCGAKDPAYAAPGKQDNKKPSKTNTSTKADKKTSAKTGDESTVGLYAVLCMLSACGVAVAVRRKKENGAE